MLCFKKDQNQPNIFFEVIVFHMNNEDVSRGVQSIAKLSYGEPEEVLIQSEEYFED